MHELLENNPINLITVYLMKIVNWMIKTGKNIINYMIRYIQILKYIIK